MKKPQPKPDVLRRRLLKLARTWTTANLGHTDFWQGRAEGLRVAANDLRQALRETKKRK